MITDFDIYYHLRDSGPGPRHKQGRPPGSGRPINPCNRYNPQSQLNERPRVMELREGERLEDRSPLNTALHRIYNHTDLQRTRAVSAGRR